MKKLFLISLSVFLLNISTTYAATYYVSNHGKDSNQGTLDAPFATVEHAASVIHRGDIVYVGTPTGHESIVLEKNNAGRLITYTNHSGTKPMLDKSNLVNDKMPLAGNEKKAKGIQK